VVLIANAEQSKIALWYADQDGKEWRKLSEYPTFSPEFAVLGFDADDTTMLVTAKVDGNRWGVFKYDFVKKRPGELLAYDKSIDVKGGLIFAPDSKKLLGIRMQTEPPKTLWFDAGLMALQSKLDDAFPGMVNVILPGNTLAPMLILSYSSTQPGQYYLYNPDRKKVSPLFAIRPWIDPKRMSTQLVYDYEARDGLPIVSYLTLPSGRAAKALPMVVLVHDGPWIRDYWGYDAQVQMLAGLGYAVLQPQFRGSSGFGDEHFKKSLKQWGLAMQDDLTDGVTSLIKQGVVDPHRICIMGAGYGGYSAMMGLVRDPDLYRCAVNLFGPTNLFSLSSSATAGDSAGSYSRDMTLGNPKELTHQFNETSPSKQAAKIKAPVLMFYGEKDRRIPREHGEDMRDALKKFNKVYEYTELEGEEHGIADEKTRYRVFGAIQSFLMKYNPAQ
jgi:dienelactone hydrolase